MLLRSEIQELVDEIKSQLEIFNPDYTYKIYLAFYTEHSETKPSDIDRSLLGEWGLKLKNPRIVLSETKIYCYYSHGKYYVAGIVCDYENDTIDIIAKEINIDDVKNYNNHIFRTVNKKVEFDPEEMVRSFGTPLDFTDECMLVSIKADKLANHLSNIY